MKEFLAVFSYTFFENARKKVFIISTIIVLIITIGLVSTPAIIQHFQNSNTEENTGNSGKAEDLGTVYVIDNSQLFKNDLPQLEQVFKGYTFKTETKDQVEKLKDKIKATDKESLIILNQNAGIPTFEYFVKKYGSGIAPDELSKTLKSIYLQRSLKSANVPEEITLVAVNEINYNVNELGKGAVKSLFSGMLVIMLLFFSIYFYGYGVSMSVASEKTSRVMELLITSTKPSKIVLGKSAAMGFLGLLQLLLIIIAAAVTYKLSFPGDFSIAGEKIDFSNFTPFAIAMFLSYFILGYALYAMMNAVAGSTVSKTEDINSALMPISIITLVSFYLAYGSASFPDGSLAKVTSLIPFSAPFSMPTRILVTDVPLWQISISLGLLLVTIVLMAMISIKLYSSAVLHYGKRLKLKDLFKLSKQ